jgi:hypothetical protein
MTKLQGYLFITNTEPPNLNSVRVKVQVNVEDAQLTLVRYALSLSTLTSCPP